MSVSKLIPGREDFRPLYTLRDGNKQIDIKATHNASCALSNGQIIEGHGDVFYRLRGFKDHTNATKYLELAKQNVGTGKIQANVANRYVVNDCPDSASKAAITEDLAFDFTAFMYVLGFVTFRTVFEFEVALARADTIKIASMWARVGALPHRSLVIASSMYQTDSEFVTLLRLLRTSGVTHTFVASRNVPKDGSCLRGASLRNYCLSLAAMVIGTADTLGYAPQHYFAWFRGATAAVTLMAHTDEGGWLRRLLRDVQAPAPVGIVNDDFALMKYPRNLYTPPDLSTDTAISWYLAGVRCISAADPVGEANPYGITILAREGTGVHTHSNFPNLRNLTDTWGMNMLNCIADAFSMIPTQQRGLALFNKYFDRNVVDSHFDVDYLVPFFMVEPGALSVFKGVVDHFPSVGTPLQPTSMPLLPCESSHRMHFYYEMRGSVGPGGKAQAVVHRHTARSCGFNYVWGATHNPRNFLSAVKLVTEPKNNFVINDLAMAGSMRGDNSYATGRWMTPHCAIPNPAECIGGSRTQLIEVSYIGDMNQGCVKDWNAPVQMGFTGLVYCMTRDAELKTCRNVPRWMHDFMRSFNKGQTLSLPEACAKYQDPLPLGTGGPSTTTPPDRRPPLTPPVSVTQIAWPDRCVEEDIGQGAHDDREHTEPAKLVEVDGERGANGNTVVVDEGNEPSKEDKERELFHTVTQYPQAMRADVVAQPDFKSGGISEMQYLPITDLSNVPEAEPPVVLDSFDDEPAYPPSEPSRPTQSTTVGRDAANCNIPEPNSTYRDSSEQRTGRAGGAKAWRPVTPAGDTPH